MSILSQINLNYLRVFLAVYRAGSMTKAARDLHLTQSGISQQIKSLEDSIGISLFDRINRRIVPTDTAQVLFEYCSRRLDEIESIFEDVSSKQSVLSGRIKIGFPPIFGNHVLLPLVAKFSRQNPKVKFELRMGLASEVTALLLDGRLDFGFIDALNKDPHLVTETVTEETLEMCCRNDLAQSIGSVEMSFSYFKKLPFVGYVEGEPVVKSWFRKNFSQVPSDLNVVATVIDSNAVLRIITEGMAAGLLPTPLIETLKQTRSDIQVFPIRNRVFNRICLSYLYQRQMGSVAQKCFNDLRRSLGLPV